MSAAVTYGKVLIPSEEIAELRARLEAEGPAAGLHIAVPTSVDPIQLVLAGSQLFRRAQLLVHPDGRVVAGLGTAWHAVGSGPDRFEGLRAKIEAAPTSTLPMFTGFSFHRDGPRSEEWAGFAGAAAVLSQIAVVRADGESKLMLTARPGSQLTKLVDTLATLPDPPALEPFDPGDHSVVSHPPSAEWRAEVDEAVGAIRHGDIAKVVLSRSVVVTTEQEPQPFALAAHLRWAYPQCYVFVWQEGDATFVGASPELLLEKTARSIRVNPLAGSAPRGEGEADDRAIGEALMHSAKDRQEHALVVDDVAARLVPLLRDLQIPAQPSLRRMATVQHLSSEIVGTVEPSVHPMQLVDVLHPTPAVGGTPRAAALAFVDKFERMDRGWYTGGIGWLTADGDATLAIPLRCALIRGRVSHLYAGAGIVADSRPGAELEETRLKFRPMLSLLTAT